MKQAVIPCEVNENGYVDAMPILLRKRGDYRIAIKVAEDQKVEHGSGGLECVVTGTSCSLARHREEGVYLSQQ